MVYSWYSQNPYMSRKISCILTNYTFGSTFSDYSCFLNNMQMSPSLNSGRLEEDPELT